MRTCRTLALVSVLATAGTGCALSSGAAPPAPAPAAAPPVAAPAGLQVEKVREELAVTPWEMSFSGVRGADRASESVTVRNQSDGPVAIRAVAVHGAEAATFVLGGLPELPLRLPPKGALTVTVDFAPRPEAAPGVHRAVLRFQTGSDPADGPAADLSAVVLRSRQPGDEPSLAQVLDALGFSAESAPLAAPGATLAAAVSTAAGAETPGPSGPFFQRANPAPVALNPVARFSRDGVVAFGFYAAGAPSASLQTVATIAAGQHQRLNPELGPEGQTTFDPGEAPFGLWLKIGGTTIRSESAGAGGVARPGMRIHPLRPRDGALVANAYLVAVEAGSAGAYQDVVFVLWNARAAERAP